MRPDIDPGQGELGLLLNAAIAVIALAFIVHGWLDARRKP